MNSILRIIEAFGGIRALRQQSSIEVQKGNRRLEITFLKYGLKSEGALRLVQFTDGRTDREMHFRLAGENWRPFFFRIPGELEVILHGGAGRDNALLQSCLEEQAAAWDLALFQEGFDWLGQEQFQLFGGQS